MLAARIIYFTKMLAAIAILLSLLGNVPALALPLDSPCPPNIPRDDFTKVSGDSCFRFEFDYDVEYAQASRYCQRKGGQLAMPTTQETNAFLTHQLRYAYNFTGTLWIGLDDMVEENKFVWADGFELGSSYSNWADANEGPRGGLKHASNHLVEDCVAMDAGSEGKWRDYRCGLEDQSELNAKMHFICEFAPARTTTTSTKRPTTTTTTTTTTPRVISVGEFQKEVVHTALHKALGGLGDFLSDIFGK